jgi:3-hydroxyisobutyrate dehydrogenase-like beta-hydroxyacid dehydrogenase
MANVTFLGLGLIGSGLAQAALERGDTVTVWNRTASKADELRKKGARVAETPAEAVHDAERVHLALLDDAAVDGLLTQLEAVRDRALVIDHSTTAPVPTARRLTEWNGHGGRLLHAPVFMGPKNARDATGLMLCAGPQPVYDAVRAVLETMTGQVWYLGERPDLAAAYKLFGNTMGISVAAALADVLAMARALDIDPVKTLDAVVRFKPAGVLDYRGVKMAHGDFGTSFKLETARKDVRLMIETAGDQPLAILPGLAARMDALIAGGAGDLDVGVLGRGRRQKT